MVAQNGGMDVRLAKGNAPALTVPGALLAVYQPRIGHQAVFLWLNLRWKADSGEPFSPDELTAAGMTAADIEAAFDRLIQWRLAAPTDEGGWIVFDPLSEELLAQWQDASGEAADKPHPVREEKVVPTEVEQADTQAASASVGSGADDGGSPLRVLQKSGGPSESSGTRSPLSKRRKGTGMLTLVDAGEGFEHSEDPDMQAVVQIYHKRIGMMGPTQYERLRFWVEEKEMEGAVVALAIEETVHSADVPRISYLEGILRNWYNAGLRTFAQLQETKKASKVLSASTPAGEDGHEGVANAGAYQNVSPEMVAKWKELYPDEYDG